MSASNAEPPFSWNIFTDLRQMWSYTELQNAWIAGTLIAIVAGIIGYLVVLRRSSFATHALGHTGFSGAAAAVLVGANPVYGLLIFTSGTGTGMALLGNRASNRDVEIGTVLAFALGLGLLFLNLYNGYATEAYSILFGEILGISPADVVFTEWASLAVLLVLVVFYRPLLFSSLDEDVAEARGMPLLYLNVAFMLLLAVTITIAVQIIGVLLIFALMVTPAAIAVRLTKRPATAVVVSVLVAVTAAWMGLFVSYYLPYPVSFFIVGIVFGEYVCVRGMGALRQTSLLQAEEATPQEGLRVLRQGSLVGSLAQGLALALGVVLLAQSPLFHPQATWGFSLLTAPPAPVLALAAAVLFAAVLSLVLYFSGFRKMASSWREFSDPAFLTLLGILGISLLVAGLALLVVGSAAPAAWVALSASWQTLDPVAVLFGAPMFLLGFLLLVVGFVGQAVGSWRVGLQYDQRTLRSAAVLTLFPLVSIAGFLLAYVGYRRASVRGDPSAPLASVG